MVTETDMSGRMGTTPPSYKLNVKDMEQKKTFEPFERVLVFYIGGYDAKWTCDMFSHISNGYVVCLGGLYKIGDYDILPFAGNSHLVGTSDMPREEVVLSPMELIFVFDKLESIDELSKIVLGRFVCLNGDKIGIAADMLNCWAYCIQYNQFNPNDLEETRKNILCVKSGKLVRAIG